jgi:hypothetical protein
MHGSLMPPGGGSPVGFASLAVVEALDRLRELSPGCSHVSYYW